MIQTNNNTEDKEQNQMQRSISEKWLNLVYEKLERTDRHEVIARNGSQDLNQYVEQNVKDPLNAHNLEISYKQKAIDLIFEDFKMILIMFGNDILDVQFKTTFTEKLNKLIEYKSKPYAVEDCFTYLTHAKRGGRRIMLGNRFFIILESLGKLREELVTELTPILFLTDKKVKGGYAL